MRTDTFQVTSGDLGPVPPCKLEIRPLTVFIGPQGSGKSLVAQTLYAFEELPYLVARAGGERGASTKSGEQLFRWILDRLRSSERTFATFAQPRIHVRWTRGQGFEHVPEAPATLDFKAYYAGRQIKVAGKTKAFIEGLRKQSKARGAMHHAIFFPTERMVISQLHAASGGKLLSLPLTYELFQHWLYDHAARAEVSAEASTLERLGRTALAGSARLLGEETWKWNWGQGAGKTFDLDMASSGQRANWSLPFIWRSLFSLRATGDVARELTLFVEEPEIHLHPKAQVEIVKMMALMINAGFRLVVTTHSLTVLYALNNLIQASRLGSAAHDGVPAPEFRLNSKAVSVYAFQPGRAPRQLVDAKAAFIDERELGRVSEELSEELNAVAFYAEPREPQRAAPR